MFKHLDQALMDRMREVLPEFLEVEWESHPLNRSEVATCTLRLETRYRATDEGLAEAGFRERVEGHAVDRFLLVLHEMLTAEEGELRRTLPLFRDQYLKRLGIVWGSPPLQEGGDADS